MVAARGWASRDSFKTNVHSLSSPLIDTRFVTLQFNVEALNVDALHVEAHILARNEGMVGSIDLS